MYQALLEARASIFWEVYILVDDKAGKRFVDLLCDKAKAGIEVKLIIDSLGSLLLSRQAVGRLKESGVRLVWYNPLSLKTNLIAWFKSVWVRNHRKILIIDGKVAFIGGVNVTQQAASWDDLHLRVEGVIVHKLVRAFAKNYIRAGGSKAHVKHLLVRRLRMQFKHFRENIKLLLHAPQSFGSISSLKQFYRLALESARRSVTFLTPYYVPDHQFLSLIRAARKRGVTINILLPAEPDHTIMRYMAEAFYDLTARAGANLFLLKNMNHGKAVTVDSSLGLVGSANLTHRSFFINEEAGVYFTDHTMVKDLRALLDRWKRDAVPLLAPPHRTWLERLMGSVILWFKTYV
jgi:cardiolipin synthase